MKKIHKSVRLQFSAEERAIPEMQEHIQKVEKAEEIVDKTYKAIPKKHHLTTKPSIDEKTGGDKSRLHFEEIVKSPDEVIQPYHHPVFQHIVSDTIHKKLEETEKDNSCVEAVHRTEIVAENVVQEGKRYVNHIENQNRLKPYRDYSKAEKDLQKANRNYQYHKNLYDNPQSVSNTFSRHNQKQNNQKTMQQRYQTVSETLRKSKETAKKAKDFLLKHGHTIVICSIVSLLLVLLMAGITACSTLLSGGLSSVAGSTFLATEEDITGAEEDYLALETTLQEQLSNIETTYIGFDEYQYSIDRIWHDPYILTSILSVVEPEYTRSTIQGTLIMLFEKQYEIILTEEIETRYKPEARVAYYTDADGNTYPYHYTVEVEYPYYILNVELVNHELSQIPYDIFSEQQIQQYELYCKTHGNRPDIAF